MKILGIDFETQGNDSETTNPTEVGAILIDVDAGKIHEHQRYSSLIYEPAYPPQTQEIVELTGITDEMLRAGGKAPSVVFQELRLLIIDCEYLMAHNAPFDKGVLYAAARRCGVDLPDRPWICTLNDVPYPPKFRCKKLSHLALDHGMTIDPSGLHRAINDVELMFAFVLTHYPLDSIIKYKALPDLIIRAVVPHPKHDNGRGKDAAKAAGFRWQEIDGKQYQLQWVKKIKADQLGAERAKLAGYEVVVLSGGPCTRQ